MIYLVAGLVGFGALMVYSASALIAFSESGSTFGYFLRQILYIVLGALAAIVASRVPLKWVARASVPILVVSIFLLIAVLFIGVDLNGARRWIRLPSFDLQPSEVAKLAFIIYLSAWLAKPRSKVKDMRDALQRHLYDDLLPFMLLLGVLCVLIILQPDLDTTAILAMTALTIYYVSGRDALHTLGSVFIVFTTALVGVFAALAAPYRLSRVSTYINFWLTGSVQDERGAGFQVWNGLIAIGTGGLLGVGFGESRQKLFYLQNAAFTDSIFSVIAEEFGLLGSLIVILAFLFFLSMGTQIARRAPDRFSALLALGITTWITIQAFLNIGANLALIPFGGIPLPFLSYGGSNTLIVMTGVGLLWNVHRSSKRASARKPGRGS